MLLNKGLVTAILLLAIAISSSAQMRLEGKVVNKEKKGVEHAVVAIIGSETSTYTNKDGEFKFVLADTGKIELYAFHAEFGKAMKTLNLQHDISIQLQLKGIQENLKEITVEGKGDDDFSVIRLNKLEGTTLYAGKKNDVVLLDRVDANKATANARQIFAKVPGLNIWESDNAGLQLGIGVRGLSPNRTSNFNTRQNGYDIAADALGYPESYYTPPADAIERIEVVRGAASLQFGTQFGGMLNFHLKGAPEDKAVVVQVRQSAGSFGLWNSYNSVGGKIGKLEYFAYTQVKTGQGWRENSEFDRQDAFVSLNYWINSKWNVSGEYTHMAYNAQQAAGLTDRLFEINPRQSIRDRNWFGVRWNLFNLSSTYRISPLTEINVRNFALIGKRNALGYLGTINTTDPGGERDLLKDNYLNYGNETRLIHRYGFLNQISALVAGVRLYRGHTQKRQGNGSAGDGPNFSYLRPNNLEKSDFTFPSSNVAVFVENAFNISDKFTVSPGLRYEWLRTEAAGTFREIRTNLANDTIYDQSNRSFQESTRGFLIGGIGLSYEFKPWLEGYANISQNYRAINFNDMKIVNPNFQVDPNLQDERGYSADIGIRGTMAQLITFDISGFYLSYNNRIGLVMREDSQLFRAYRLRTNISDARNVGLESFVEMDWLRLLKKQNWGKLKTFVNLTWLDARYTGSEESAYNNKEVELVPKWMLRTGMSYRKKRWSGTFQYSYTAEQFTDATNAIGSSTAVHGIIPAYGVMDLSISYQYKWLSLSTGINNLTNNMYFTRRAAGYPGPGVIPADGRNWYFTLGIDL